MCVCVCESESCSVVSDSLWLHELYSPWNSPGQNTGVGSLSLLQGFSRGSSWPRNRTMVSCIAGRFFTNCAIREAYMCVCVYVCVCIHTYIPHLLYPFGCRWTHRLLPCLGYCKLCCKDIGVHISFQIIVFSRYMPRSGITGLKFCHWNWLWLIFSKVHCQLVVWLFIRLQDPTPGIYLENTIIWKL